MFLNCFSQQFCILLQPRTILILSSSENEASTKIFEEGNVEQTLNSGYLWGELKRI